MCVCVCMVVQTKYKDRQFPGTHEDFQEALANSKTVYVGNLSFYTTETQLYEVFSKVGEPKRIIMGLDKLRRTPCGFCFIVYYTREVGRRARAIFVR